MLPTPQISSHRKSTKMAGKLVIGVIVGIYVYSYPQNSQAQSAAVDSVLAPAGCAMAHCNQLINDTSDEIAPTAPLAALWQDTSVAGSLSGLGCSSNGEVAACSFAGTASKPVSLKVYSATGDAVWTSSSFNSSAHTSAPMVDPSGGVIMADDEKVARFTPSGSISWQTKTPGGIPISPTVTDNGAIILATFGGPVSAYDCNTGALLHQLELRSSIVVDGKTIEGFYDTVNTPAVHGNRIYISTQFHQTATNKILPYGRLYALDFRDHQFSIAWTWDFEAPSGGSPLVIVHEGVPTIYFDGSGITPGESATDPQIFAVTDNGSSASLIWRHAMIVDPQAGAAQDPRGGLWTFAPFFPGLFRLDPLTGAVLQTIYVDTLVPSPGIHVPSSAMTIAGTADKPVMILSATTIFMQSSDIIAIDLNTSKLLWSYDVGDGKGLQGVSMGQFPIIRNAIGAPEVVFTTYGNGTWALGTGQPVNH